MQTPRILQPVNSHRQTAKGSINSTNQRNQYTVTTNNASYQQYTSQSRCTHVPLLRRSVKIIPGRYYQFHQSPSGLIYTRKRLLGIRFSDVQRLFDFNMKIHFQNDRTKSKGYVCHPGRTYRRYSTFVPLFSRDK